MTKAPKFATHQLRLATQAEKVHSDACKTVIGRMSAQAYIAADVRLIGTNKGRVVASTKVTGTGDTSVMGTAYGAGLSGFSHPPMERGYARDDPAECRRR